MTLDVQQKWEKTCFLFIFVIHFFQSNNERNSETIEGH